MTRNLTRSRLGSVLPRRFAALDKEMNQLFGDFFSNSGERVAATWLAPTSLWEDDNQFHI